MYADDLILTAESEVELCEKIVNWKAGMEVKALKMITRKTKVISITDGHQCAVLVAKKNVLASNRYSYSYAVYNDSTSENV